MAQPLPPVDDADPSTFILNEQKQGQFGALQSLDADPEQAARALQLSEATGAHPALVYGDIDRFEQQTKAALTAKLLQDNQFLAQYANSHPLAPKVSADDWGQLDAISAAYDKLHPEQRILPGEAESLGAATLADWAKTFFGGAEQVVGEAAKGASGAVPQRPLFSFTPQETQELSEYGMTHPISGLPVLGGATVGRIAQDTGAIIGGVVSGAIKGGAEFYHQLTGADASEKADTLLEVLSDPGLAATLGPLAGPLEAISPALKAELHGQLTTALHYISENKPVPVGISPIIDRLHAEQAKLDARNLDDAYKETQKSSTLERNRDFFAENFGRQRFPDARIGIDADAVRKLYGDKVPAPDDGLLGWVEGIQDQLALAEHTGGDIEVPLADWLAKADPEVAKELHDSIRVRPGGVTLEEAKGIGEVAPAPEVEPSIDDQARALREQHQKQIEQLGSSMEQEAKVKRRRLEYIDSLLNDAESALNVEPRYEDVAKERLDIAKEELDKFGPTPIDSLRRAAKLEDPAFAKALEGEPVREAGIVPASAQKLEGEIVETTKGAKLSPYLNFPLRDALAQINGKGLTDIPAALHDFYKAELKKFVGDVPIRIVTDANMRETMKLHGAPEFSPAFYTSARHEIYMSTSLASGKYGHDIAASAVLHEGAHALSLFAMDKFPELRNAVEDMRKYTQKYLEANEPELLKDKETAYALTNHKEWWAQAWSIPDFQRTLSMIPISEELAKSIGLKAARGKNLFDAMRRVVKILFQKLFGGEVEVPETMIDGLFHLQEMMEKAEGERGVVEGELAPARPTQPELPGVTRLEDRKLFESARAIGMSEKRLKNIMGLIEKRRAEDATHQEKIANQRATEQQTKEWKENYAAVRDDAAKNVRARPDVAADLLFRQGELYGDKVPRQKLDSKQLTPEQRAAIPKEYAGEGGIHPDDAAGLFGYQSGDSLVEGLARLHAEREREGLTPTAHLTKLTDVEAERVMRRDYGTLEQNILEEAKDHVISPTQLDLLHEYWLGLAEHAGAEMPLKKDDMKTWVQQQFNTLISSSISTDKYLAQSGRAGQDIIDALAENRPQDALKGQEQQYASMLLANEAKKFEKKLKQFMKIAGRFAKREVGGVATSYTNWIHDILMRSMPRGFVKRLPEDLQGAIGREEHDTLHGFVQQKSEQFGLPIMLPDFMYEGGWNKPLKDMTVEEATSVMDAVQTLYNLGRKENKFILRGDEQDRVELRDKMLAQAKGQPQRKIKENPTKLGEWWGDIKQVAHKIVQMETSWNRLDGGDKFGLFNRAFAYGASDATHDYSDLIREYGAKLAKLDTPKDLKKKLPSIFRRPSNDQIVDMRRENLIQMMRNIGTQSGLDKLVGGWNGTRPGQVEHELHKARVLNYISQHATKEDWDFVEAEGKIYAEMFGKATEMLHNQGIVPPQREPLRQVQTPSGAKDGWYHPVIYDQVERGSSQKLMGKVFDDMDGLEGTGYFRATTAKGWTKARTGYIAPIYLHMDRSAARMTSVLRDVAIRPFVINASKMFYDKTFVHGMRDALGPTFADKLDPFLRSMAGMGNPPLSKADAIGRNMLQTVMRNTIGTLIGGNIHTIEKHSISAAINSIVEVGPLNFAREARLLFTKGDLDPKLTNQQVAMQKSGELRRRLQNAAGTVSGEYERLSPNYTTPSKLRNYVYEYGTAPIGFFDLASAVPTWTAAYKNALEDLAKLHPGEDIAKYDGLAIDAGNRAVRRAHGSSAISSRPEAMRGGPLARTFTQLYGFFNQAFQRNYEAMWRTGAMARDFKEGEFVEGSKQLGMVTLLLFQGVIAPAFVEEMVTPYTNSDRDSLATWAFKTLAMGASGTIPLVREFVHGMISGTSAGFGLLGTQYEQLQSDVRDIKRGTRMMDAEHGGKTIKDFNTLFGMVTGLTNNEMGNLMKSTWDVTHKSKETPRNVIEFGREALTGHARKEQRR